MTEILQLVMAAHPQSSFGALPVPWPETIISERLGAVSKADLNPFKFLLASLFLFHAGTSLQFSAILCSGSGAAPEQFQSSSRAMSDELLKDSLALVFYFFFSLSLSFSLSFFLSFFLF